MCVVFVVILGLGGEGGEKFLEGDKGSREIIRRKSS